MSARARIGLALVAIAIAAALAFGLWRWREHAAFQREQLADLEAAVAQRIAAARGSDRLPGISAAFALPDGRVGAAAAGFADVESKRPMETDTRFLAGSVGKSFHAALILALDREGVLDLDAPISRWLGDEPWFDRVPNAPALTLRLLLQHRSGIPDHVHSLAFWAESLKARITGEEKELLDPVALIETVLDRKPLFPAGQGFAYGDTGYVLAGLVVERATGRSSFDQIEERFLAPLGLDGIVPARTRRIPDLAAGYQVPINPFLLPAKTLDDGVLVLPPMIESTAGGLATTPRDVVRWAEALFEGRALAAPYLEDLVGRSVETEDGRRYGLGVYVYDTPLGEAWGHGGWFPGYRSALRYFVDSGIAVCVQTNRDFAVDVDALTLDLGRLLRDALSAGSS